MVYPLSITKFVGTISLGILTGISYNLTTITLPSLALLPSASSAALALRAIQTRSTTSILTLASTASCCLLAAYTLAPARAKHPYLLYTALVACAAGQGVEYWANGFARFPGLGGGRESSTSSSSSGSDGYVDVVDEPNDVNGEMVELDMARERRVQGIRSLVSGIGFAMGVVGIWGDGA